MEKILRILNELGYDVLFLPELNKTFIVNRWEASRNLGQEPTGFNFVAGIEISSALPSIPDSESKNAIKVRLERIIADFPELKMKFSDEYKWIMYVSG